MPLFDSPLVLKTMQDHQKIIDTYLEWAREWHKDESKPSPSNYIENRIDVAEAYLARGIYYKVDKYYSGCSNRELLKHGDRLATLKINNFYAQNGFEDALKFFNESIRISYNKPLQSNDKRIYLSTSQCPLTRCAMARVYIELNLLDKAKAMVIGQNNYQDKTEFLLLLAEICIKQKNNLEALDWLDKVSSFREITAESALTLGDLYSQIGAAEQAWEIAKQLKTDNPYNNRISRIFNIAGKELCDKIKDIIAKAPQQEDQYKANLLCSYGVLCGQLLKAFPSNSEYTFLESKLFIACGLPQIGHAKAQKIIEDLAAQYAPPKEEEKVTKEVATLTPQFSQLSLQSASCKATNNLVTETKRHGRRRRKNQSRKSPVKD